MKPPVLPPPHALQKETKTMTIQLHCFGESGNAYKAALALELAGLDWEPVFVDEVFLQDEEGAHIEPLRARAAVAPPRGPARPSDGPRAGQRGFTLHAARLSSLPRAPRLGHTWLRPGKDGCRALRLHLAR